MFHLILQKLLKKSIRERDISKGLLLLEFNFCNLKKKCIILKKKIVYSLYIIIFDKERRRYTVYNTLFKILKVWRGAIRIRTSWRLLAWGIILNYSATTYYIILIHTRIIFVATSLIYSTIILRFTFTFRFPIYFSLLKLTPRIYAILFVYYYCECCCMIYIYIYIYIFNVYTTYTYYIIYVRVCSVILYFTMSACIAVTSV